MTEDMLMINISNQKSHSPSSKNRQNWSRQKWKANDTRIGKRKASFGQQEGISAKQRKISAKSQHFIQNNTRNEKRAPNPVAKSSSKPRSPTSQVPGERTGHDQPFIKTSSLFRNNPEIPDVLSPAVTQVKEKVFTSNSFQELGLHPHLLATLEKVLNVTSMTSVQKQTIPVLLSGKDAVVRSQTGSGKTLAYGIPLVQCLQAIQPKVKRSDGPLAVVIVPTRELAQQSFQIFQKLLKPFTWIVPGVLMGGEKRKAEKARLRKGINILISTPGRLVDHIKNTLSIAFSAVCWLVLDEADRTMDMGFEKDLTVILNALNAAGASRQNVLLSATLTQGLSRLTSISMTDPVYVHVSEAADSSVEAAGERPPQAAPQTDAPQAQADSYAIPDRLQQHLVVVPSKLRLVCLAAFILAKCKFDQGQKLIVFVSSCEAVEFLFTLLSAVLRDQPSGTARPRMPVNFLRLHGNMQQEERTQVFQDFSQSATGVLLCTDVAARGLDLPQVTWIVQYNPPTSAAEYVHRVGRTARIGAQGNGLLFLTPSETAYVDVLASHKVSLCEMKMEDILSTLMRDKGKGQLASKRPAGVRDMEVRQRATALQTDFENYVHSSPETVQAAKKALQSFVRAYTAYPSALKHIFHIRSLHLGHAAKSFGLRDAPQGLSLADGGRRAGKGNGKDKQRPRGKLTARERVARLIRAEYSSGTDGQHASKKKRRKKNASAENKDSTDA